ncbi:Transcription factor TFIIB cyclin-like protein [Gracilaria domingensis]|nr:Transcription factor TFIIB cyclin-like protein [Gracilaria domingensis]
MPSLAPPMEREMPEECPECGSDDIVENWREGTADCRSCGLILIERLLDLGTEWRTFTSEEGDDPNRAGPANNPLLEFEHGTSIGTGAKGGGALSVSLNRAQNRNATSAADKVMMEVMQRIGRYRDRLNLARSVSDRALELFKRYQDLLTTKVVSTPGEPDKRVRTRTLREEEVNEIVASSLFIACRNQKVARSYKEICTLTGVPKKNVGATVKKMERQLTDAKTTYVRGTDDFVTRFGNFLDLPRNVINAADVVADEMQNHEVLHGKTYTTLAAASIYIVTLLCKDEHKRTAKEIADVTGVAEVTIKSTYRAFYPYIEGVVPEDFECAVSVADLPQP